MQIPAPSSVLQGTADPVRQFRDLASRYPKLYHYTRIESLKALLTSKGLLARPVWDFADTEEYIYGLRLIREELIAARSNETSRSLARALLKRCYQEFSPDVNRVLDIVIQYISHEISNVENPMVQVYVACLTTEAVSKRMQDNYGTCVIALNFELPLIAYHSPSPFTEAMLSFVAYEEQLFRSFVLSMGFHYEGYEITSQQLTALISTDRARREEIVSAWVTEKLCLFAPNIKRPEFKYEKEWRLKSAISKYSSMPHIQRGQRSYFVKYLPSQANFIDESGRRYLQKLVNPDGKFISQEIYIYGERDFALLTWIRDWQAKHSVPIVPFDQFSALIDTSWPNDVKNNSSR